MQDLGLLLLRIVAGVTLAAHGYPKLFGGPGKQPHPLLAKAMGPNYPAAVERSGPGFVTALKKMGVPNPETVALAVAVNMGVASYKAHWKNGIYGQGGFEFPLLLGTVALSLCLAGPGRLSVDHLMRLT